MTAIPSYPQALPGPQAAPITDVEGRVLSTLPGPTQARALQRERLALQRLRFLFTHQQVEQFMGWYTNELFDGGAWFRATWPIPRGGAARRRFVGAPSMPRYIPGFGWQITATVEVGKSEPLLISGDPYIESVVLLLHMDGSVGSRDWIDSSAYAHELTETGSNEHRDFRVKFGSTSGWFNDGAIQVPNSPHLVLGRDRWTIEAWVYTESRTFGLLCKYFSATPSAPVPLAISSETVGDEDKIRVKISSDNLTYGFNAVFPSVGSAYTTERWTHIAVVFDGHLVKVFSDGSLLGAVVNTTAVGTSPHEWQVGRDKSSGAYLNGYMDEFRITKGLARYSTNFTPPAEAFSDS